MPETIAWDRLFESAKQAMGRAYAPYSQFQVGAAVWFEGGFISSGCNVEAASYGLSLCAERNAVAHAVAEARQKILAVAIITSAGAPCPPCGMCRQVLMEFGAPEVPVRSRGQGGQEASYTLGELLPHAFTRRFL